MTTATKTANYSDKDLASLKSVYVPSANDEERKVQVQELALATKHSVQSVRMKLTQLGLYVKASPVVKAAKEKKITRDELLESIANKMQVSSERYEGLQRANRDALLNLLFDVDTLVSATCEAEEQ